MKQEPIDLLVKKDTNGQFNVEMHALIDRRTYNETFHLYLNEGYKEILYTRVYSEHNAELIYNYYKQCINVFANLNGRCGTSMAEPFQDTTNSTLRREHYHSRRV